LATPAQKHIIAGTHHHQNPSAMNFRTALSLGINFTNNGIHVFFNIGRSDVLARETLAMYDITAVHEVMELLNKAPAQVRIDAKFVSVAENDANVFGFLSYLGNFTTNPGAIGARAGSGPSYPGTTTVANPSGIFPGASPTGSNAMSNAALPAITGILTEPQFRAAIQAIEQRDGTKILAVPGITTESGRQARMAVADNFEIPTNATSGTNGGSTRTPPVEGGPVLDVIPTVSANGFTIQLSLTAGLQEFTGYESTAQIPANAAPLVPRFRNFSATNLINVWDGETALIGGLVEENAPGRNQSTNSQRRNLMVFVTARIVDPAGKPVHTDEDMPFAKASIPPQPPFSPPK
jgi:general secretion pathway protein D